MKACIACKHFWIDPGFCGSDITGSEPPTMRCARNRFYAEGLDEDFAPSMLAHGTECPVFEISDLALSKGWIV